MNSRWYLWVFRPFLVLVWSRGAVSCSTAIQTCRDRRQTCTATWASLRGFQAVLHERRRRPWVECHRRVSCELAGDRVDASAQYDTDMYLWESVHWLRLIVNKKANIGLEQWPWGSGAISIIEFGMSVNSTRYNKHNTKINIKGRQTISLR